MQTVLIVQLGSTFPSLAEKRGDFDAWIRRGLGLPDGRTATVDARFETRSPRPLPGAEELVRAGTGVVLTGSHANVTDEDKRAWTQQNAGWVRDLVEARVPLLGICYGHQLLAEALGGRAGRHPRGREVGTVEIELHAAARGDRLFQGLPERFAAHVCHAQTALALPPGAVVLASNAHDPHQAFRAGGTAWGVQFHPEFDAEAARAYVAKCSAELEEEGQSPRRLRDSVRDTPHATTLLARFAALDDAKP